MRTFEEGDFVHAWCREPDGSLRIGRVRTPGTGPTTEVDWWQGPERNQVTWFPTEALVKIDVQCRAMVSTDAPKCGRPGCPITIVPHEHRDGEIDPAKVLASMHGAPNLPPVDRSAEAPGFPFGEAMRLARAEGNKIIDESRPAEDPPHHEVCDACKGASGAVAGNGQVLVLCDYCHVKVSYPRSAEATPPLEAKLVRHLRTLLKRAIENLETVPVQHRPGLQTMSTLKDGVRLTELPVADDDPNDPIASAADRFLLRRPLVVDATTVPTRSGKEITVEDLVWFVESLVDDGALQRRESDRTEGRGAATCGIHRFADVEAAKQGRTCPWCTISTLSQERATLPLDEIRALLDLYRHELLAKRMPGYKPDVPESLQISSQVARIGQVLKALDDARATPSSRDTQAHDAKEKG